MAPLVSASATLRLADARLPPLVHVASLVSRFLDPTPRFSLQAAVSTRSARLARRAAVHTRAVLAHDTLLLDNHFALAMEAAIESDDLAMAKLIHELHPAPLGVRSLQVALLHGSLELVEWVAATRCDRTCSGGPSVCIACLRRAVEEIASDDLSRPLDASVVVWCVGTRLVDAIADREHQEMMWKLSPTADMLQFLVDHERVSDWFVECALQTSIVSGRTDVVQRFLNSSQPQPWLRDVVAEAAVRGHDVVVDYIVSTAAWNEWRHEFVWDSLHPGGRKVLQRIGGSRDEHEHASARACQFGNFEVMQWLHAAHNVVPCGTPTDHGRSEEDVVSFYNWMESIGVREWPATAMGAAVRCGHVAVMEWLYERGANWCDATAMSDAAGCGHLTAIEWLLERDLWDDDCGAFVEAARHGHLQLVQRLAGNAKQLQATESMACAAASGRLEVAAWLLDNCPGTCAACALRIATGAIYDKDIAASSDGLRWLFAHCSPPCAGRCLLALDDRQTSVAESIEDELLTYAADTGDLPLLQSMATQLKGLSAAQSNHVVHRATVNGHHGFDTWISTLTATDCR